MAVRIWHLFLVGSVAVAAVAALVTFMAVGRGVESETKTVAVVAAAVPRQSGEQAAAANVRAAVPSVEAFYAEHMTYTGATTAALRAYDPGLDPTVVVVRADADGYCIESSVEGQIASARGPGGAILIGGC